MITGKNITEVEYRKIARDSASSLKEFSLDRRKYRKKYIELEKVEEEISSASVIGSLVDCLLFIKEEFDSKFYLSSTVKPITGKMGDFVNALVDITIQNTDENGNVTKSFGEMATEARIIAQFDWKLPVILDKFVGQQPEILYKELKEVKSKGLTVITLQDANNAEKIVQELKTNEFTAPIMSLIGTDNSRYSIYTQFKLDDFEVDGLPMKGMLDLVIVDHKEKTISIFDLKCTFSVEGFYNEYYLYRRAYIQAYVYKEAILNWKSNNEELRYYTILNPKFIVCDSISYYSPLIYTLDSDDMDDSYNGFEHKGKKYIGVKDIIADLKFAKSHNIWNISRINYENDGIVKLKN